MTAGVLNRGQAIRSGKRYGRTLVVPHLTGRLVRGKAVLSLPGVSWLRMSGVPERQPLRGTMISSRRRLGSGSSLLIRSMSTGGLEPVARSRRGLMKVLPVMCWRSQIRRRPGSGGAWW